ncbi:YoaK family protein [Mycobacterium sp. SMC-19]|uniref:YoaK family protein n=1 Tax=Mycobacterium sp. SMC-19 TaxID=3381630 RepID=UPI0038764FD3
MPIASPLSQRRTVVALLLLTFATGLVDAVSVLVLGRVFVANMTGNAIFLGFLFVPGTGFDLTAAVVAVAGFLLGAVIGGRLFRIFGEQRPRDWISIALGLEAVMLLVLAALAGLGVLHYDGNSKLLLIAGLAVAFGVQNSTARQFGIQELYTTVLTSTIVGIGVDSRLAGGTGERGKLRYGVVFVMILGAVVGATLTPLVVAPIIAMAGVVVLVSLALFRYG